MFQMPEVLSHRGLRFPPSRPQSKKVFIEGFQPDRPLMVTGLRGVRKVRDALCQLPSIGASK
jgi:hypothetical protein